MDITLTLNGRDFSGRVDKYAVKKVIISGPVVTTLDYVEHAPIQKHRDEIRFTLIPSSDAVATLDYAALDDGVFSATYTDPNTSTNRTKNVRVTSDLNSVFGLKSVDGNRYYKQGEIVLRATDPD